MRFTKTFNYEDIKQQLKDIYEEIVYSWSEFNPVVCDANDETKLKELAKDLDESLKEVSDILDKMSNINRKSFI